MLDEGSCLLLQQTKGDDSYTLLWLVACSVGSRVSRRTSLMVLGEKLEGFTQCVIPSEKDVGCVCERERERVDFLLSVVVVGLVFPVF